MLGLAGLFVIGSIGFWVLMILVTGALITALEYEKPGWATLSLGLTLLLLGYLGDFNALTVMKVHPFLALLSVVGYFLAGTVWAFGKWWFFLRDAREKYGEERSEFLKRHGVEGVDIPNELLKNWQDTARHLGAPRAKNNKLRILTWMMYWPWSFAWTILNDPVKRAFRAIYNKVQVVFQKMADDTFADVAEDFRKAPEPSHEANVAEDYPRGARRHPPQ